MKHAYLITANGNFQVLNSCLKILDSDSNDIYITFDKKTFSNYDDVRELMYLPIFAEVKCIDFKVVNWGGYSQVAAVMSMMESAIASGVKYSYLHFLQGSDLPIKSNDDIQSFFVKNAGYEFVNVDSKDSAWAENCCRYRYYLSHNRFYRKNRLLKGLNIYMAKFQKILGILQNTDIQLYYGSALFSITDEFAQYLLSRREEIRKRFRWTLAPDEKFIQTMIMNSPFAERLLQNGGHSTSNAMLIDWNRDRGKNSPHVWQKEEFDYIISRNDDNCYARKFIGNIDMDIVNRIRTYCVGDANQNQ